MDLNILKLNIEKDLKSEKINSNILLNRFSFLDDNSRNSSIYYDNYHYPFYFYLGKYINPIYLMELGYGLGLNSGCFFKSCKSVENFLAFQKNKEFYSDRIPKVNTRKCYRGKIASYIGEFKDPQFLDFISKYKWDLILIPEFLEPNELRLNLDLLWDVVNNEGLIVCDCLFKNSKLLDIFQMFSKTHNRDSILVKTRYGVGILQK